MSQPFVSEVAEFEYIDGIMHFKMLNPDPSLEAYKKHFYDSLAHFGADKFPMPALVWSSSGKVMYSKEIRDFMATDEFKTFAAAVAIVTDSVVMRVGVNLFFKLTRLPYPSQAFTDKTKALAWLQAYKKTL